jgi:hypothetical protein
VKHALVDSPPSGLPSPPSGAPSPPAHGPPEGVAPPRRRLRDRLAAFGPARAAAVGVLLTLPALATKYGTDDYLFRCQLGAERCPAQRFHWAPWDLFRFFDGSVALARARRELGFAPWWSLDEAKTWFFRPFGSLTHAFDWLVIGERPWAMHLHSVLWYGLLAAAAAALYRRLLGPSWVAGLAALLYAVDDAHGLPVGWLSNRNAICAAFFGLLAVFAYARWREGGSWRAALLAHAALAGSLLSAEAGVAAFLYMGAYALTLDKAPPRGRALALLPSAALVVAWRLGSIAAGYGAYGSDFYLDPGREPLAFARTAAERVPALLCGQFTLSLLTDLWSLVGPEARAALWAAGVAVTAAAAWLAAPLLRRDPRARFFALGAVASSALVAGVIPTGRLMLPAGFGAHGLLALWLADAADSSRKGARRGAAVLAALHLGLSALLLPLGTLSLHLIDAPSSRVAMAAPLDDLKPNETAVVLATPYATSFFFLPYQRAVRGAAAPDRFYTLATGCSPAQFTRVDDRTLRVRIEGGWSKSASSPGRNPLDRMFRTERSPMRVGQRVELEAMAVEVTEIAPDGMPAEARFHFREPLEGGAYRWLSWADGALPPASPPGPGESRSIHTPCSANPY